MENNLDNILKFDANGDIIYSKDLFMILVSGEFDDIIINHPELLDIIRKGVSELFDDWSILDTALTIVLCKQQCHRKYRIIFCKQKETVALRRTHPKYSIHKNTISCTAFS